MNARFISDLHLGHRNIAINDRKFASVQEMNEHIIEQWNSVVTNQKDITYILGDVSMDNKSVYYLLNRLNGVKHVVMGNHDSRKHVRYLLRHVDTVAGMINYKNKFIITHAPIHPCSLGGKYTHNIHGHTHSFCIDDPKYINVSCEVLDYRPRSIEELLEINKLKYEKNHI